VWLRLEQLLMAEARAEDEGERLYRLATGWRAREGGGGGS
jgi:hypothetical protein